MYVHSSKNECLIKAPRKSTPKKTGPLAARDEARPALIRPKRQPRLAARARRRSSGPFAEVVVQGEQNVLLVRRPCQYVRIGRASYPDATDRVTGSKEVRDVPFAAQVQSM
jgi:hypothetical protein